MYELKGLRACVDGIPRWRLLAQLWLGKSQYQSLMRCVTVVTRAISGLGDNQVLVFCYIGRGQATHGNGFARLEVYLDRDLGNPIGEAVFVGWFDLPDCQVGDVQPACLIAEPFQDRLGQLSRLYPQQILGAA